MARRRCDRVLVDARCARGIVADMGSGRSANVAARDRFRRGSEFQSLVQRFKDSFNVLLEEIAPHITKFLFHVFWRIFLLWSRFSKFHWANLRDIPVPAFSIFSKRWSSYSLSFPKLIFLKNDSGCCVNDLESLGVSKVVTNWFWESWSCLPRPKNMKMICFRVFPK